MKLIYGEGLQNAALAVRTYRERYQETRQCLTNPGTIVGEFVKTGRSYSQPSYSDRVSTPQAPVSREEDGLWNGWMAREMDYGTNTIFISGAGTILAHGGNRPTSRYRFSVIVWAESTATIS
ncbi:LPS-assembly protein LptD [Operophtera brumata]|uniref:LPS-assembly protein LptD n=1 Tax=Operophtera brumata TaxID=104452 RepID=A0A0L7LLS4_OPEBR|nr:LPS-assembly protein LptD [Operophtera brumata]